MTKELVQCVLAPGKGILGDFGFALKGFRNNGNLYEFEILPIVRFKRGKHKETKPALGELLGLGLQKGVWEMQIFVAHLRDIGPRLIQEEEF